jgi:sugar lactone lactonase YvrE
MRHLIWLRVTGLRVRFSWGSSAAAWCVLALCICLAADAQQVHYSGAQTTILANLTQPSRIALDKAGDIFISDVAADEILEEVPGANGYVQQVLPTSALSGPYGVAVDGKGNVFVADSGHNRVLMETPQGSSYQETVVATSALNAPHCVYTDANENLFICDTNNGRVLKETPVSGGYQESVVDAKMWCPSGIVEDPEGNLYVADTNDGVIFKETLSGSTYTESKVATGSLFSPTGVALDASQNLYIGNVGLNNILKETPAGTGYTQSVIASTGLLYPDSIVLDSTGALLIVDTSNHRVVRQQLQGAELGAVDVGATATGPVTSLVFTFDSGGSLAAAPVVSRQGLTGADFTMLPTSTCVAGGRYKTGANCTVDVNFAPKLAGSLSGAVALTNGAGNPLATGFVHGTGVGPQASFSPAVETVVASGLLNPRAVAADAGGNLYIADTDNQRILKETPAGGAYTQTVVATSTLQWPLGVAVDGNGNVYVSDTYHSRELKETIAAGAPGQTAESVIVATGLNYPAGIAVDGAGVFYLADSMNNRVLVERPAGSSYVATSFSFEGLNNLYGVTPDGAGNLYLADSGNNRILKETYADGTYTQSVIPTSTLAFPRAVAVDANGDLFIADTNNGRVIEETLSNGVYIETVVRSGLASPDSLALDGSGNLYITDTATGRVLKESFATPPSLAFPSTSVGSTSPSQLVTVTNIGNAPLSFPVPASGSNPAISDGFSMDPTAANACPSTTADHDAGADLAAGTSCVLSLAFAPIAGGTIQGYLVLSDTSLNQNGALQTIALAGTAVRDIVTLQLLAPASATYGNPVQITAQVSNGSNQDAMGAGSVGFSDQVGAFGTQALTGGRATQSYLAAAVGTALLNASYTPSDSAMDGAKAQATMQILAAPLTAGAADASRAYGSPNPTFTGTVTGAVNGDNFQEKFTSAATVTSPAGPYPIVPSVAGPDLSNYTVTSQDGTLQVTAAQLSARANNAARAYGATNPVFTGTLTGVVNNDQLSETFTTSATISSPVGSYGIVPAISGAAVANYTPVLQNGTLTVSAAQLSANANNASRAYGAANPVFTGALTGVVNEDQLSETFTTSATISSPVGSYGIVPAISGAAVANYTPVLQNGTLTISAAQLSATANNASRVYGQANPVLTGAVTGAVNGDSFTETFTTVATPATAPGSYAIVPAAAGANLANYAQILTNGTLTITAGALTVTAQDQARIYGQANPVFTGSLLGAAPQDSFTESFTTAATQHSPAGSYAIVPTAAGPALADYAVSTRPGTLTVDPATLTVTAASASRSYGSANPVFAGQMEGELAGDSLTVAFASQATAQTAPGTYPIHGTVSGAPLGNYTVAATDGVLTIEALPTLTTLTLAPASGAGQQTLTATVTISGGSAAAALTGQVLFYAGKTLLAEVPLTLTAPTPAAQTQGAATQGVAIWTGAMIDPEQAQTLTAVYQGDTDCLPSTSAGILLPPNTAGFWMKSLGDSAQVPAATGQTTAFPLQVGPGLSGLYPGTVTFSVQGLPAGAVATFSPAQLGATLGTQNVTLTVTVPAATTKSALEPLGSGPAGPSRLGALSRDAGGLALTLILLPIASARRLRNASRGLYGMCLFLAACVAALGLAGCGFKPGAGLGTTARPDAAQPVTYTLTVVMTTGAQQVTMPETLVVQPQ